MTSFDEQLKWILVADDEPTVRQFVERALNYAGYAVTTVSDGVAALAELKKQKYDLLLTDVVMPDMDGTALTMQAGQDYPDMKILMMTGYSHQAQSIHQIESITHEVVSKPFTLDEITRRVTAAMAA